jgi:hypothetical protein
MYLDANITGWPIDAMLPATASFEYTEIFPSYDMLVCYTNHIGSQGERKV